MVCLGLLTVRKVSEDSSIKEVSEIIKLISQLLQDAWWSQISSHLLPESASLPALGLSNKAEKQATTKEDNDDQEKRLPQLCHYLLLPTSLWKIISRDTTLSSENLWQATNIKNGCKPPNGNPSLTVCSHSSARNCVFNAASDTNNLRQLRGT